MKRYVQRWLPPVRIYHAYPLKRRGVITWGRSPVREQRTPGSVEGVRSNGHSYSDWVEMVGLLGMSSRLPHGFFRLGSGSRREYLHVRTMHGLRHWVTTKRGNHARVGFDRDLQRRD